MMEKGLRLAVDHDELALYYQTIHRCADGGVVGAEALLRWNHPDRGLVQPDHFVPLAEDTRLILPIGAWVLRSACEQITRWNRERGTDYRVAVNLSVRQFQQHDLVDMVEEILAETGTDPRWLELEITESVAMQNADWTWALLHELRRRGISIAIDDFGAGQSSLIYLRKFPITRIKIDQAFIRDMTSNETDAAIVSAVIRLTHDLGLSITAEGVETEEQWRFLQERGCDYVQGYFFTHPVPADAVRLE
jgi:EAL domain-containing protein (putative c-di-GMP-specific phosphodiesterase class I)